MKKTILVTIPVNDQHRTYLEGILADEPGYSFVFAKAGEVTPALLSEAEVLLGNLPPKALAAGQKLSWVQLNSAGADAYVVPGVLPEKVQLTNSAGAYGLSVSEHMVAVTFCLVRNFPLYAKRQACHDWIAGRGVISIEGATVLVLGLGDIGGRYAQKMKALGAYTIGVRRNQKEKPDYLDEQYTIQDLDALLPRADIVAMVLPGGDATYHLMDERRLRLMKPGSYILNDGRGTAIDLEALKAVLREGHLRGAALDVTEPEPLPKEDDLWDLENVMITPHVAGNFFLPKTLDNVVQIAGENLRRYLKGEPLHQVVDRKTGY